MKRAPGARFEERAFLEIASRVELKLVERRLDGLVSFSSVLPFQTVCATDLHICRARGGRRLAVKSIYSGTGDLARDGFPGNYEFFHRGEIFREIASTCRRNAVNVVPYVDSFVDAHARWERCP